MKRRLQTLQTMMRVANCRVEVARTAYAQACLRLEEAEARHEQLAAQVRAFEAELLGSVGASGEFAIDDWQRKTAYLKDQHEALGRSRQQVSQLAEAAGKARDALCAFAREHAVAEKLSVRTADEITRESARREGLAQDEQWILLEERRS